MPSGHRASLIAFLVLTIGAGWVVGVNASPDAWYASLAKPAFNPPNWVFAPVWTLLYILMAVAGWRVWIKSPRSDVMGLWVAQFLLNVAWSPIFFRAHSLWGAAAIILAILTMIVIFVRTTWTQERIASLCFVPYGLWVSFAALLNVSLAMLNA